MAKAVSKGSRVERKCARCERRYIPTSNNQKYCSKGCYNRSVKFAILSRKHECPICKKEFNPHRKRQKYCSKKCAGLAKRNRIKIECKNCGKLYAKKASRAEISNFCSRKCYAGYKQQEIRDDNNPNWRGGVSKKNLARRGVGNRAYRKGRYYENSIRKEFEAKGFYIIRSAASKGLWDIIAINSDIIIFIQSKVNALPRPSERKAMSEFKCPPNSIKQFWRFFGMGKKEIWTWTSDGWIKESYD